MKSLKNLNVVSTVVAENMCIGCGICAALCPANILKMRFNQNGNYEVEQSTSECLDKCGACLSVCPFWNREQNEDTLAKKLFSHTEGIFHRPETGHVLNCYLGYSDRPQQRMQGASGGLATWFLQRLMEEKIVDYVVSVIPNNDPDKLFKFAILKTAKEVQEASRSCYYPVELSEVLEHVMSVEGHYAVMGLPCFVKGLRLAMMRSLKLRRRVKALVGLVCGHTKSKFFVEYLAALCDIRPESLKAVTFRYKGKNRESSDYGVKLLGGQNDQNKEETLFWTDGMRQPWTHDYFKPNPCYFCDDVFAETADIVFMDAWLPQCKSDYRGHSVVINRQERFKPIWDAAVNAANATIQPIDIETVISTQRGTLNTKRDGLQFRLNFSQYSEALPPKRVIPTKAGNMIQRRLWGLKMDMSHLSFSLWSIEKELLQFQKSIGEIERKIRFWEVLQQVQLMIQEGRFWSALQKRCRRILK